MRSLSLLVLLLFAVVACAAATSAPSISTLMKELVANGAPQRLRTCKDFYLTEERPKLKDGVFFGLGNRLGFWALHRQELSQGWTIEQINDREVAIKSSLGNYISHGGGNYAKDARDANEWEILTPWKNTDGSWSFKSRAAGWLSAETYHTSYVRHYIMFYPGNSRCEHWWLEPYTPPAKTPLMAELLANGGRRRFKSHNGLYLTYREKSWIQRNELLVTRGTGEEEQKWTIEQINEKEVTIRGPRVYYVSHSDYDQGRPAYDADTWEMLTPVKNDDGSWSFKSRWDKWLSGGGYREGQVHFMPENKRCEKWTLEEW